MVIVFMLLLLLLTAAAADSAADSAELYDMVEEPDSPVPNGRSFYLLGVLFRRWRDRWLAFHNTAPLYAGAAYPINGYYNCPQFGCNPAAIAPQTGYLPGAYYANPVQQPPQQQQQQQTQGNSNVYIYQSDANNPATGIGSYFGPPPGRLPPPSPALPPRPTLPTINYRPPWLMPLPPISIPLPIHENTNSHACGSSTFPCVATLG